MGTGVQGGKVHGVIVVCDPWIWNGDVPSDNNSSKRVQTGQHLLDTPMSSPFGFYVDIHQNEVRTLHECTARTLNIDWLAPTATDGSRM
jgi:hypothetical protein